MGVTALVLLVKPGSSPRIDNVRSYEIRSNLIGHHGATKCARNTLLTMEAPASTSNVGRPGRSSVSMSWRKAGLRRRWSNRCPASSMPIAAPSLARHHSKAYIARLPSTVKGVTPAWLWLQAHQRSNGSRARAPHAWRPSRRFSLFESYFLCHPNCEY